MPQYSTIHIKFKLKLISSGVYSPRISPSELVSQKQSLKIYNIILHTTIIYTIKNGPCTLVVASTHSVQLQHRNRASAVHKNPYKLWLHATPNVLVVAVMLNFVKVVRICSWWLLKGDDVGTGAALTSLLCWYADEQVHDTHSYKFPGTMLHMHYEELYSNPLCTVFQSFAILRSMNSLEPTSL